MFTTKVKAIFWALSLTAFVAGSIIGPTIHATTGAVLWGVSALCALAPFASHRTMS